MLAHPSATVAPTKLAAIKSPGSAGISGDLVEGVSFMMRLCWIIKQRLFIYQAQPGDNKRALAAFLFGLFGRFFVVDGKK